MTKQDPKCAERNRLLALVSAIYPSSLRRTDIEGWDEAWHWCVYVELPTGTISHHIHEEQLPWFNHVPRDERVPWDGAGPYECGQRILAAARQHATRSDPQGL